MKTELTIYKPPIIGYLHHANFLSLIDTSSTYAPWLFSNYMHLQCDVDLDINRGESSKLDFCHETFEIFSDIMDVQRVHRNIIDKYKGGVLQFVCDCLSDGWYIEAVLNERYIPGSEDYRIRDFDHNILLHGYDANARTFSIRSFIGKRYDDSLLSFDDFLLSYNNVAGELSWAVYFKVIKPTPYVPDFDLKRMNVFLQYYLNADYPLRTSSAKRYGIETYQCLLDYLSNLKMGQTASDVRGFQILWEHKKIMTQRVNYLVENRYLEEPILIERFSKLEAEVYKIRNLLIKYEITGKMEVINKMIHSLHTAREVDDELTRRLASGIMDYQIKL